MEFTANGYHDGERVTLKRISDRAQYALRATVIGFRSPILTVRCDRASENVVLERSLDAPDEFIDTETGARFTVTRVRKEKA